MNATLMGRWTACVILATACSSLAWPFPTLHLLTAAGLLVPPAADIDQAGTSRSGPCRSVRLAAVPGGAAGQMAAAKALEDEGYGAGLVPRATTHPCPTSPSS